MTRRQYVAVAVVFCASAAAVPAWRALPRPSRTLESGAVALVNGRVIPQDDLDLRLSQILPMASYHGHVEPTRLLGFRRAALDELILDELIFQRASARSVAADTVEVGQMLKEARGRFSSAAEFEQALAEIGLTEKAFRQRLERLAIVGRERALHVGHEPTDAELRSYYDSNGAKFERPEQVRLFEILIKVDPGDTDSAQRAERRAHDIAGRLRRGEAFGQLARGMSEDDHRVKGGDFGFVHRGLLDPELEAAVFGAPTGKVSVSRTLYGFHVFLVTERMPPSRLTFDEARSSIAERLRRAYRDQDRQRWRGELLAGARIEILDGALRTAAPAEIPEFDMPGRARGLSNGQVGVRRADEAI